VEEILGRVESFESLASPFELTGLLQLPAVMPARATT
jgi:hypothetical protein